MQGLLKASFNTVKQIMLLGMFLTLLSSQANAIEVGDHLPLGQIQSIQGETFTSEHWTKRNTVVQVWATWCSVSYTHLTLPTNREV